MTLPLIALLIAALVLWQIIQRQDTARVLRGQLTQAARTIQHLNGYIATLEAENQRLAASVMRRQCAKKVNLAKVEEK